MIFAETERLFIRALEQKELPRLVQLIGEWDIIRWLTVKPFPYKMKHAEELFTDMQLSYDADEPQFFALALKPDNLLIGGIGLHPPRHENHLPGELEIGYWLGRDFWGKGLVPEAAREVIDIGFARPATRSIGASTAIDNIASQNVLRKLGMRHIGTMPRDYAALRGDEQIFKWLLTREEWEAEAGGRGLEAGKNSGKTS